MYSNKKNNLTLTIIWYALFAAIFIYLLVLYLGPAGQNYSVEDISYTSDSLFKTLVIAAGFVLILGYLISKYLASKITNDDFSTPYIIKWATADAIAILGFFIGYQLESLSAYQPFFIISLMIMLNNYPRLQNT